MIHSNSDLQHLKALHPDLARVVRRCSKDWRDKTFTWMITCSSRTLAQQKINVRKGASKTMRSRHLVAANGYSHAVDLAPLISGTARWDWPLVNKIAAAMKAAAKAEGVPMEWGGDWKFKDGPHFQLPWSKYPGTK